MKKFYDTVNHQIIIELFEKLCKQVKTEYPSIELKYSIHIFKEFLKCYSFNYNILPLNHNQEYWNSYDIKEGNFPWIDEIELKKYYMNYKEHRIGVPQGGALSGLIANIYLNEVDITLEKSPVLYLRFCDDMIVIHHNKSKCEEAKEKYLNPLEKLKLFPHSFTENNELYHIVNGKINYKEFWKGKSKGVYKWNDSLKEDSFPWIAFVGYEINFNNQIRVRKRSLQKEIDKQKLVVNEIIKATSKNQRCKKGTALESAINRLIGMSVGRINLYNFSIVSSDMCWKKGFQKLNFNKHSVKQMKMLDRNRNKLYYDLFKKINELEETSDEQKYSNSRLLVKYDKPFSYYYQVLERNRNLPK